MEFLQRNALIEALVARGFKEGKPNSTGWDYRHEDGFTLWFNSGGRYRLDLSNGKVEYGVTSNHLDILAHIDRVAAAL
jgi:hypothetical protein